MWQILTEHAVMCRGLDQCSCCIVPVSPKCWDCSLFEHIQPHGQCKQKREPQRPGSWVRFCLPSCTTMVSFCPHQLHSHQLFTSPFLFPKTTWQAEHPAYKRMPAQPFLPFLEGVSQGRRISTNLQKPHLPTKELWGPRGWYRDIQWGAVIESLSWKWPSRSSMQAVYSYNISSRGYPASV